MNLVTLQKLQVSQGHLKVSGGRFVKTDGCEPSCFGQLADFRRAGDWKRKKRVEKVSEAFLTLILVHLTAKMSNCRFQHVKT